MVMRVATLYSHTSTVLVARGRGDSVTVEPARLRDRVTALWRARRLDRALAEGVPPETNAALALRAQRLTEPERRWSIARALRRIVRDAETDQRPRTALGRVMPNACAVQEAREGLLSLADTLDDPGPVAAHGVAQAWLLVTDGTGPLYNSCSTIPLGVHAARAARDLRPWPA
jgi:hypothetical protein